MRVRNVRIKSWADLLALEPQWSSDIFRGQSDASWPLESSLARAVRKGWSMGRQDEKDEVYAEYWSVSKFQRRAHYYLQHLPPVADYVAWLSVMQHHGAPTRLVDFTRSLYVALYFAIIDAEAEAAVWMLDEAWLMDCGCEFARKRGIETPDECLRDTRLENIYKAANSVLTDERAGIMRHDQAIESCVLLCDPVFEIPRLSLQQGRFLMQTSLYESFLENLLATGALAREKTWRKPPVTRILIPRSLRSEFLRHLEVMNISAETLFPGIDGFARSLIQKEMMN